MKPQRTSCCNVPSKMSASVAAEGNQFPNLNALPQPLSSPFTYIHFLEIAFVEYRLILSIGILVRFLLQCSSPTMIFIYAFSNVSSSLFTMIVCRQILEQLITQNEQMLVHQQQLHSSSMQILQALESAEYSDPVETHAVVSMKTFSSNHHNNSSSSVDTACMKIAG